MVGVWWTGVMVNVAVEVVFGFILGKLSESIPL